MIPMEKATSCWSGAQLPPGDEVLTLGQRPQGKSSHLCPCTSLSLRVEPPKLLCPLVLLHCPKSDLSWKKPVGSSRWRFRWTRVHLCTDFLLPIFFKHHQFACSYYKDRHTFVSRVAPFSPQNNDSTVITNECL